MSSKTLIFNLAISLYVINTVSCDGWLQGCPTVKPVEYFDIDSLVGNWLYYFSSETNDNMKCERLTCQKSESQRISCSFNVWTRQNLYEYGTENEIVYDPAIDASSFMIKSKYSDDKILKRWYGDVKYTVLDYDSTNLDYILLYSCKKLYFGIKSEESAYVLSRSKELDTTIQVRIKNILNSFSYRGKPIKKVDHFPSVCFLFDL